MTEIIGMSFEEIDEELRLKKIASFKGSKTKYKNKEKIDGYYMSDYPISNLFNDMSQEEIEERFIPIMWDKQEDDEQVTNETIYKNNIGLSKPDAAFFGHIVKNRLDKDISLKPHELENVKRRLSKYINQLRNCGAISEKEYIKQYETKK
jgi:hypothetical protein